MQKSCGGCMYFIKFPNPTGEPINGLCDLSDCGCIATGKVLNIKEISEK